jgi:UDP-N-acetylmuramoylalanine--D-glutamate ligase
MILSGMETNSNMLRLENKDVLVIGLGGRGRAACELLRRNGARVTGIDSEDTPELRNGVKSLRPLGVEIELGVSVPPQHHFNLAVLSPAVPMMGALVRAVCETKVPMIGEMELGYQQAKCLSIAIAGTNGKGTTAEMVERLLINNHRKAVLTGHRARPLCSVVDQTKELDYLVLQVNSFQLEMTQYFRPAVAVLMNISPDHLDRYSKVEDYIRANARLFMNQQSFDWAIVQSETLSRLKELGVPVPAKTITFSATDSQADIRLERGLLISSIPNWSGPLLNMEQCKLRGPHNAENLMAALAVGHVLRLPLENMSETLNGYDAGPHRCELVAEIDGVQFINDSKAMNLDASLKALQSVRPGKAGAPNVFLIAGGEDQALDYYDAGPLLSKRVKHAYLVGESGEKIRAAWSLFTPCSVVTSLLEAIVEAAKNAASGDAVLLSPACSSFDQFRNYQERGEIFCRAVKSIGRGGRGAHPHMNGKTDRKAEPNNSATENARF